MRYTYTDREVLWRRGGFQDIYFKKYFARRKYFQKNSLVPRNISKEKCDLSHQRISCQVWSTYNWTGLRTSRCSLLTFVSQHSSLTLTSWISTCQSLLDSLALALGVKWSLPKKRMKTMERLNGLISQGSPNQSSHPWEKLGSRNDS